MDRFKLTVENFWKDISRSSNISIPPGLKIDESVTELSKINNLHASAELDSRVFLFDQFASWLLSLAQTYVLFLLKAKRIPKNKKNKIRTFTMLSCAIASHYMAIRTLVMAGHDLAAKQVLRSAAEYIDVATLLAIQSSLVDEFIQTQSSQKSNQFWHTHVARGKAIKLIEKALSEIGLEEEVIRDLREYREQEHAVLGMAAHPSYIASFMTALGADDAYRPMYLGLKDDTSLRTLEYAIYALSYFIVIGPSNPFTLKLIKYDEKNEEHFHVQKGEKLLMRLMASLSQDLAKRKTGEKSTKRANT